MDRQSFPRIIDGVEWLSHNFTAKEFECPCCHIAPMSPVLIKALQRLRDFINSPIIITSGYRCKRYNDSIPGSAKYSLHMGGMAADLAFPHIDLRTAYEAVFEIEPWKHSGGVGLYPQNKFIHLDIRDNTARWGRLHNQEVPLMQAVDYLFNQYPEED